jgi:hypothetical protein
MRKASQSQHIRRILRKQAEWLVHEFKWELDACNRDFLCRELMLTLALMARMENSSPSAVACRTFWKFLRSLEERDASITEDICTEYLGAYTPGCVRRDVLRDWRFLKWEARRGHTRIGFATCVPFVPKKSFTLCGVEVLLVPVATHKAADTLECLAAGGRHTVLPRRHG